MLRMWRRIHSNL